MHEQGHAHVRGDRVDARRIREHGDCPALQRIADELRPVRGGTGQRGEQVALADVVAPQSHAGHPRRPGCVRREVCPYLLGK